MKYDEEEIKNLLNSLSNEKLDLYISYLEKIIKQQNS